MLMKRISSMNQIGGRHENVLLNLSLMILPGICKSVALHTGGRLESIKRTV